MAYPYAQKLTGNTKTEINGLVGRHGSMLLVNNHASSSVTIDLYIASQTKDAITDTSVDVNLSAGYAKTTSSQAIVVDGGTFTDATCDYNNDPTIAHDDDDGKITANSLVSGTGIPDGAYVASVTSDTAFELSASTTGGSVTNGTLSFILASDDVFLNEKIWKSDGTFIGTCTAVGGSAGMTFGGGLEKALTNNDSLYTGTKFYILNNVVIPNGASLKLESNEFQFNSDSYKMYIISDSSSGNIDIITKQ